MLLGRVIDYLKRQNIDAEEILSMVKCEEDSFFDSDLLLEKLKKDYTSYGRIIVAYDYDDTVCPSKINYSCNGVANLLKLCSKFNDFEMICFTARSTPTLIKEATDNLKRLGIRYDAINDDVPRIKKAIDHIYQSKVLYSIFLDDRAGLYQSFNVLVQFVEWYLEQKAISE
jgi:hypothetical protein